ncbi:MAG: 50S ribosomal protein L17 [Verrucomicrobia bacterium]|nr:50S ribosomal protein L17 [Verrucomicrobiota bacterium]
MRHRKIRGNLSRTSAHRKAMVNNMITSLFAHERIETTVPKARAARRVAERMITYAKRNTLHARRLVYRRVRDNEVLQKLFDVLGPRYQNRPGGYTRVVRLAPRIGDGSELAILELVDRFGATARVTEEKPTRRRTKKAEAAEKDVSKAVAEESLVEDEAPEAGADDEGADEAANPGAETPKE